MKSPLILPILLLGAVSALHLNNDALNLETPQTVEDLSPNLEGSGEQEGALALPDKVNQSEGEEKEASGCEDVLEDEEALGSDLEGGLDEDLQCPSEEDTVQIVGSPGCATCRYLLVRRPSRFSGAQHVCRRCYRGNLVSVHNFGFNNRIRSTVSGINQGQVWIGGTIRGWLRCKRFSWTDGSAWNFAFWAPGQPGGGKGRCVALCTRGGHWRRALCKRSLPFVCSY
ncbi:PREDICTED: proteoglycan 3 [Elephantulus edwardii]|uniref:proteoglycan 3 n=1 Tax=Elephantulus edwardii TaxID=28737 RepID=UPI0003F0DE6B|nr:PREDICTED: proteoglycan 3 [Elephantulus edwardii]